MSTSSTHRKDQNSRTKLWSILAILAVVAGGLGYHFLSRPGTPHKEQITVKELPPLSGAELIVPNLDESGDPLSKTCYDGSEIVDGKASKKYDPKACQGVATELVIPVVGDCPIEEDGAIGAPSDYTTACSHADERGGMAYLAHSVRGPRVGALERIGLLKQGDSVTVDGKPYTVETVSFYPTTKIPNRTWGPNKFSLITCLIGPKQDAGGEIVQDIVVELSQR